MNKLETKQKKGTLTYETKGMRSLSLYVSFGFVGIV